MNDDNRDDAEFHRPDQVSPAGIVREWVRRMNAGNVEKLVTLYSSTFGSALSASTRNF